ncbi:two-component regulator propeller domain-containing protein, partial [Romboutsia sp. 13368]|uniref:two-component regulator propeller domain-containing protein n=1 Tax=Romboutsia sp. 13368 TaxID=2708053 RepID=UPI0025E70B5C
NGLAKYNEEEDNFYTYKNKNYDQNSLVNNTVCSIIEDKSGLIWVGTESGISIFDSKNKIVHYKSEPFNDNSLKSNFVHGIYEDKNGILWVGSN